MNSETCYLVQFSDSSKAWLTKSELSADRKGERLIKHYESSFAFVAAVSELEPITAMGSKKSKRYRLKYLEMDGGTISNSWDQTASAIPAELSQTSFWRNVDLTKPDAAAKRKGGVYDVEGILCRMPYGHFGDSIYLVRWRGYPAPGCEDSWEPLTSFNYQVCAFRA